jgi:uncharacterized RmlC-like cupin family protein
MEPTMTGIDHEAPDTLLSLSPADIDQRPWRPVVSCPGVQAQELWRLGRMVDALITYEPGASTPGVPHPGAHHHIWIVSGAATIAGRRLTAGSYVYVPPGVAHSIGDVGEEGCMLLQMHRPQPAREAEPAA